MAKFNQNVCDLSALSASDFVHAGILLNSLLTDEEHNKIEADWHKKYGKNPKEYPFWKYCLDKIQVSYKPRS